MKRPLKIALIGVAGVVLLVGGAFTAAALFLNLDEVVNAQIAKHRPEIEAKLGRKVTVGKVETEIFPTLGARIEGLTIAADPKHPQDDQPLLQVKDVSFQVSLLQALLSRGKTLRIQHVSVNGLRVSLVRYADGTLSDQDVLDRLAPPHGPPQASDDAPPEPAKPMSPDTLALIQNASIGEISLGDAELRLVDHHTPSGQVAESYVKHLNVSAKDVRLADPIRIHIDAAIFADAKNFSFDTAVGPLPADLNLHGLPRIGATQLTMQTVDLSRIAPYLGRAVPARIDSATANADLSVSSLSDSAPSNINGFVEVKQVGIAGGQKFDARADAKLQADMKTLSLNVTQLEVKVGAIELSMKGALSDLATHPTFKDFSVRSTTLTPGLLFAYDPAAKVSLPPGFKVAGTATLNLTASGDATRQTLNGALDLTGLDIDDPAALVKPAGVPMAVRVDGDFTSTDATLRGLHLVLDAMDIAASGTVKNFAKPTLDLSISAKPFAFDRLANLVPSLHDAMQKQQAHAQGQGQISGHVKGTLQNLDAAFALSFTGVKLQAGDTKLDGNLTLDAAARGDPSKDLSATVALDADAATLMLPGTLAKSATTPLHVKADISRAGPLINVKTFQLALANLDANAHGTFDLGRGTTQMALTVAPLDLAQLARTVTAIPADKARGGEVDAKLAVAGNPNQPSTLSISADPLSVRYAGSDLRGSLHARDLAHPDVTMTFSANRLDVDALTARGSEAKPKPASQASTAPAADDPSLKNITFAGTFTAKEVVYSKAHMTDFHGVVRLKNGLLTLDDARFGVFGGQVSASGTTAEIWRGQMPFHAKLQVKNVDVAQLLATETQYGGVLSGRGNFDVDLTGAGFSTAALEKALTGSLSTSLTGAKYSAASLTQSVLGGFEGPLSKVPGLSLQKVNADNAIRNLAAAFVVTDGKLKLTKPLSMNLDGSPVTLDGALGVAGGLFLTGTYGLQGKLLEQATGGKCKVSGTVPIPVKVGGTVTRPSFAPDVTGAAANVLKACLTGQAGAVASQAAANVKAQAQAQAQAAAAQAQAQAQAAAAQAQAQARAAAAQAQANAQAQAKAAADKAKNSAKSAADAAAKKAKEALGGIHF